MKLLSGDLSPYSAKVRMQIYAKGITDIPLERPATFGTADFRKVSALEHFPILDLGGDQIPESEVIAEYLEELYPEPRLLGATPRETAAIRTVSRIGDIYLMNNLFLALPQMSRATRNDGVRDLLVAQINRGVAALEHYIGADGFAVGNRLTIADCTLVPAMFMIESTIGGLDVPDPIPGAAKVAAYWAAIQTNEHAARVLVELHRGLEQRRAMMRQAAAS